MENGAQGRAEQPGSASLSPPQQSPGSVLEVILVMGRLGMIAFGGPVAHLAYFERELIQKRRWLSHEKFADLIAFCQFLPGPASSQVGMALGLTRAGLPGMFAAWLAFSLPSVILLLIAAAGINALQGTELGWLHGLLAAVVAVVADAVWKMGQKLCPDAPRLSLAILAAAVMLLFPNAWLQFVVIALGAIAGLLFLPLPEQLLPDDSQAAHKKSNRFTRRLLILALLVVPLFALFLLFPHSILLRVFSAFAQTGALVFGGGHVVLPLLQGTVVAPGWVSEAQFLAGYGVTQAMPGPIFTLSAFLGAMIGSNLVGTWLAFFGFSTVALLGIFAPSFALVALLLPFWDQLRAYQRVRQALLGINATVVGILLAALYDPVWTKAVASHSPAQSVALILVSWLLLVVWKRPAWLVVGLAALVGALLSL